MDYVLRCGVGATSKTHRTRVRGRVGVARLPELNPERLDVTLRTTRRSEHLRKRLHAGVYRKPPFPSRRLFHRMRRPSRSGRRCIICVTLGNLLLFSRRHGR